MYKNLNTQALGISGRQSELIELALTYGFRGLDLDMADMVKRARTRGLDHARRFIESAKINIGEFALPIDWRADEATYKSNLVELNEIGEIAATFGAHGCVATVAPASDDLPYHENFEFHRTRFAEMADVLQPHGIKLGLMFLAAPEYREGRAYEFIHQAEALLTLIKTVGNPNVGLALDAWNWNIGGGAIDQLSELSVEQIVCVRLADVPETTDVAKISEQDRLLPKVEGRVDCVAIVHHLGVQEYAGPVTAYPHSSQFSGMTRDAIVQKTCSAMDDLWRAAGLNRSGKLEPAATESA